MTFHDVMLMVEGSRQAAMWDENMFRIVAFCAYIGPHLNAKKLKGITLEKFWAIPEIDKARRKAKALTPKKQAAMAAFIKEIQGMVNGNAKREN